MVSTRPTQTAAPTPLSSPATSAPPCRPRALRRTGRLCGRRSRARRAVCFGCVPLPRMIRVTARRPSPGEIRAALRRLTRPLPVSLIQCKAHPKQLHLRASTVTLSASTCKSPPPSPTGRTTQCLQTTQRSARSRPWATWGATSGTRLLRPTPTTTWRSRFIRILSCPVGQLSFPCEAGAQLRHPSGGLRSEAWRAQRTPSASAASPR
mmetsp:Transcript_27489/g.53624  ORF Transcript_27489/g.53624 Transcript_27489/m.53624 type:complete len:208 (+) Transcript_27489:1707-2330(+)